MFMIQTAGEQSVINCVAWGYEDFSNILAVGSLGTVLLFDIRAVNVVAKSPDNSFQNEHEDEINHVRKSEHPKSRHS